MSPLASPKAISSSVAMRAGRSCLRWPVHGVLNNSTNYLGLHGLVQQLHDQSPEPSVWTVDGGSDRAVNRIESNRFLFLPNRPSLVVTVVPALWCLSEWYVCNRICGRPLRLHGSQSPTGAQLSQSPDLFLTPASLLSL